MTTIEINVPEKLSTFLDDGCEYQSMINEVTHEYIELKQDQKTKKSLDNNKYFQSLNSLLEKKLG